jgi:uncharacterized membrane protein
MNTDRPPDTVRSYLDALQSALKGASPGLVSDALSDAEEHLQNELASNPERSEAQVLAAVIETYGTPAEIAEEYRSMEATLQGPFPKSEQTPERHYGFFGVISDPRAYGALIYMLLSLITGLIYGIFTAVMLPLTFTLSIFIIGIPLALFFIAMVRILSLVEGRIIEGLLGVRMPRRLPPATTADETIWASIKNALVDMRTWSSIFYLLIMIGLGPLYFAIAFSGLVTSLAVTGASLFVLITNRGDLIHADGAPVINHLMHTAPGLLMLAAIGVLMFFVLLHVCKGIGWVHGRIAELLLVRL